MLPKKLGTGKKINVSIPLGFCVTFSVRLKVLAFATCLFPFSCITVTSTQPMRLSFDQVKNLEKKTLLRSGTPSNPLHGRDVRVVGCCDSYIYLLNAMNRLSVIGCMDCTIFVGSSTSLSIIGCGRVKVCKSSYSLSVSPTVCFPLESTGPCDIFVCYDQQELRLQILMGMVIYATSSQIPGPPTALTFICDLCHSNRKGNCYHTELQGIQLCGHIIVPLYEPDATSSGRYSCHRLCTLQCELRKL